MSEKQDKRTLAQKAGSAIIWKSLQLAGTKGIFLVRTLILAAILVPEDFGLVAITLVSFDFLNNISNLGLSQALIQKDAKTKEQYDSIWILSVFRGLLLGIVLFCISPWIAALFNEPRVTDLIRLLALKPCIEEFASVKAAELIKHLNFKSVSFIRISEAIVNTLISIIFVSEVGVWAIIIGILAGSLTYLILSYIFAPYKPRFNLRIKAVYPFLTFGIWIFWSSLIAVLANSAIQVIITRNLGAYALGLYYLSSRIGFLAVEISSEVISTVAFPVYAKIQKDKEKISLTWKVIIKGILITYLPIACLIIIMIPYLIQYVLGIKWQGTISLIRLLTTAGIFGIVGDSVVPILKGIGRPDKALIIGIVQYIILISGVITLINYFGINGVAISWILAAIGSLVINLFFLIKMKLKPFEGLIKFFFLVFFVSLLSVGVAFLLLKIIPSFVGFIFSISTAVICCTVIASFSASCSTSTNSLPSFVLNCLCK